MKLRVLIHKITTLVILTSCSDMDGRDDIIGPRKTCKKNSSPLFIVNGQSTNDPRVKKVLLYSKSGDFIDRCTGVFISQTTLLTAAHCVSNRQFGADGRVGKVILEDTNETSLKFTPHPQYVMPTGLIGFFQNGLDVAKASNSEYDLAVIEFPARERSLTKIGRKGQAGDTVTVIGYGDTEQVTTAVRAKYKNMEPQQREKYMRQTFNLRSALTKIERYDQRGYLHLIPASKNQGSFPAFGDSGGPLLNDKNEIIGVASCMAPTNLIAGAQRDILSGDWRGVYTDLTTQSSKDFVNNYLPADSDEIKTERIPCL